MRIFVAGGTGLVGARLIGRLQERQDEVMLLTRRPVTGREQLGDRGQVVEGNPMQPGPWMDRVRDCDAVVNLVGENIFSRRWSKQFKDLLVQSRVQSTANVVKALARSPQTRDGAAKVLVNASAIGYYGTHSDEALTEASPAGKDFMAQICVAWENEARQAQPHGIRVAVIRIGLVLDKAGGALAKLLTPFRLGAGGPIGWPPWSGSQVISWIHHEDLVGIILKALDRPAATGPINGTAPEPVTNREFGKALGRALHRPAFLPTPPLAVRVILGEVAHVLATGQRVLPARAQALGYRFRFPTLDAALADLLA